VAKSKFAAVVVTYKTKDLLDQCLESMIEDAQNAGLDYEIVVVDNASGDGTVEMVRAKYPKAHLIANNENLGPARAFNQGIAQIIDQAEYILISNSDIKILPGTIKKMSDFLETNSAVDGVSSSLLNEDGNRQMMKTHIWRIFSVNFEEKFGIEFVGTTFAMIRAKVFRQIGGYDENYYFHNEDLDWAQRAKLNGCSFMYLPNAGVIHYVSKGSSQNRSKVTQVLYQSNIYYYKKFYPGWAWLALFAMKIEISAKKRALAQKLTDAAASEKEAIERSITDLDIARQNMIEEFHSRRIPAVPRWEE
jgi:GT2 family glycosyltransferase